MASLEPKEILGHILFNRFFFFGGGVCFVSLFFMRSKDRSWATVILSVCSHFQNLSTICWFRLYRKPPWGLQILLSKLVLYCPGWKVYFVAYFPVGLLGNSNLEASDVASVKVSLEPGLLALSQGARLKAELPMGPEPELGSSMKPLSGSALPAYWQGLKSKVLRLIYSPNLLRAFKH